MKGGWKLAFRSLLRNRRRSVVTGLAIALGFAGLLLLGGYRVRMARVIRVSSVYLQHVGDVSVYARGGLGMAEAKPAAYALSREAEDVIVRELRSDPRVEIVGRYFQGRGLVGNGCKTFPFAALGVELDVERQLLRHPQVLAVVPDLARPRAGRPLPDAEGEESAIAVAIGLGKYRLLKTPAAGTQVGSQIAAPSALDCSAPDVNRLIAADPYVQLAVRTLDGSFGAADAKVVGWFQGGTTENDRSAMIAGLDVLQRLYDTDRVSYVAAVLRDHRDTRRVVRDVRARLAAAGLDVDVYPYDDPDVNPYYVGTVSMISALVTFIGLLVASVVTLSVLNAMTLAILERTREIGTLRSIGFTRRQLLGVFMREAAALTATGITAGLALAMSVAWAVSAVGIEFTPPGVGGAIRLVIMPTWEICAAVAALFFALTLCATWFAVHRRVRERIAALVVEVAA